jgi:hypothetical protein
VIGNAVHVMKILTGEIEETIPDDGVVTLLKFGCRFVGFHS